MISQRNFRSHLKAVFILIVAFTAFAGCSSGGGDTLYYVALICQWTYLCPSPLTMLEPDFHPNATGYQMIAETFLAVFDSL